MPPQTTGTRPRGEMSAGGGEGEVEEAAGVELLAAGDDVDQVVGNTAAGGGVELVAADVEPLVDLDRVGGDDLAVDGGGDGERHPALAGAGRPQDLDDGLHHVRTNRAAHNRARKSSCCRRRVNFRSF